MWPFNEDTNSANIDKHTKRRKHFKSINSAFLAVSAMVATLRAPQLKEQLLQLKMTKLPEKDENSVFGRCPQGDLAVQRWAQRRACQVCQPKWSQTLQIAPIWIKISQIIKFMSFPNLKLNLEIILWMEFTFFHTTVNKYSVFVIASIYLNEHWDKC